MNNIKSFVTKESGEKVAKRMHNDVSTWRCNTALTPKILKFVAKVYILCREGHLPAETFWKTVKDPLWSTFSLLIDSLELSFAFDSASLVKCIGDLSKVFEKLFAPLVSLNSSKKW
jgi:hypothetical protein